MALIERMGTVLEKKPKFDWKDIQKISSFLKIIFIMCGILGELVSDLKLICKE